MCSSDLDMSDAAIFEDTSKVIREALAAVHASHPHRTQVTAKAFERALNFLL